MRVLRAPHAYSLIPPNLFNLHAADTGKLADFCAMIGRRQVECPAEGVILLKRCYVYDAQFVMTQDLQWLAPSIADFAAAGEIAPALRERVASGQYARLPACAAPTVLIAKAGARNHGHVIAEILPKLINIGRLGHKRIRLLLPLKMAAYFALVSDILRHLGIAADIEPVAEDTLMQAGPIHYMSPVSRHDARKSMALLDLRSVLASLYGLQFRRERRLFVQRGGTDGRRLTNAAAIEAVFASHGYSTIYPPTLSVPEQMALFASASHVAGPLGAGLSNIAFAPEGCEVLMIDPGLGDFFFWDLASLMQQRFTWYFAGEFRHYSQELAWSDYACDPVNLQNCRKLLAG
jgi:capsular polysaccharide biosynthesis protein